MHENIPSSYLSFPFSSPVSRDSDYFGDDVSHSSSSYVSYLHHLVKNWTQSETAAAYVSHRAHEHAWETVTSTSTTNRNGVVLALSFLLLVNDGGILRDVDTNARAHLRGGILCDH
jgi:hypothetical protein